MSKHITLLLTLLLLQLILIGIFFFADSSIADNATAKPLVTIDKSNLSKIQIIKDKDELTLIKQSGKWVLEKYPNLPLASEKVTALTNNLANTQVTWPVTSTKGSHERFKVSPENYQKNIVFTGKNGKTEALFLGTSSNYKQIYVRKMKENDVFSIEYSLYQASTDVDNWLDKSLLSIDSIKQINTSVVNIQQKDDAWQLVPPSILNDEQKLNIENIQVLVNQLNNLTVSGIANKSYKPSNQLIVHDEENKQYTYYFASQDDSHFLKRSDINQWFTIPKVNYEQLNELLSDKLIIKKEKKIEEEQKAVTE